MKLTRLFIGFLAIVHVFILSVSGQAYYNVFHDYCAYARLQKIDSELEEANLEPGQQSSLHPEKGVVSTDEGDSDNYNFVSDYQMSPFYRPAFSRLNTKVAYPVIDRNIRRFLVARRRYLDKVKEMGGNQENAEESDVPVPENIKNEALEFVNENYPSIDAKKSDSLNEGESSRVKEDVPKCDDPCKNSINDVIRIDDGWDVFTELYNVTWENVDYQIRCSPKKARAEDDYQAVKEVIMLKNYNDSSKFNSHYQNGCFLVEDDEHVTSDICIVQRVCKTTLKAFLKEKPGNLDELMIKQLLFSYSLLDNFALLELLNIHHVDIRLKDFCVPNDGHILEIYNMSRARYLFIQDQFNAYDVERSQYEPYLTETGHLWFNGKFEARPKNDMLDVAKIIIRMLLQTYHDEKDKEKKMALWAKIDMEIQRVAQSQYGIVAQFQLLNFLKQEAFPSQRRLSGSKTERAKPENIIVILENPIAKSEALESVEETAQKEAVQIKKDNPSKISDSRTNQPDLKDDVSLKTKIAHKSDESVDILEHDNIPQKASTEETKTQVNQTPDTNSSNPAKLIDSKPTHTSSADRSDEHIQGDGSFEKSDSPISITSEHEGEQQAPSDSQSKRRDIVQAYHPDRIVVRDYVLALALYKILTFMFRNQGKKLRTIEFSKQIFMSISSALRLAADIERASAKIDVCKTIRPAFEIPVRPECDTFFVNYLDPIRMINDPLTYKSPLRISDRPWPTSKGQFLTRCEIELSDDVIERNRATALKDPTNRVLIREWRALGEEVLWFFNDLSKDTSQNDPPKLENISIEGARELSTQMMPTRCLFDKGNEASVVKNLNRVVEYSAFFLGADVEFKSHYKCLKESIDYIELYQDEMRKRNFLKDGKGKKLKKGTHIHTLGILSMSRDEIAHEVQPWQNKVII